MQINSDAVVWSSPERERAGRPLIVLLHGYGSHEGDLFGLSPRLPLGPVIASLRAPLEESGGYAWFSLQNSERGNPDPAALDESATAVLDWLDTLEYTNVALLGFSQGGAIALQLNRLAPGRFAATVMLSGFVAGGEHAGDAELERLRPPVFWGRGTADQVITDAAVARTEEWLPTHSTETTRIYEDLPHSISSEELSNVSEFLREHLS
ncbi:alpha/beta hydrolase [Glaciihabitans sp. dw_435]|uniref:alpha/beta hydrolase n=1 Tax=Glaciihabitans sp. dw_435 TaxID=2720081 RepID=UPI001BD44BD7|nr:alpha/beta fold hydrolase [Glaciihabitans sp. dw_435]